ncbi:hypothetical protein Gpo141_00000198 [Globisporangium polare]
MKRQQLAVLEPTGEVFVNGLASWYDDEFPSDSLCAQYMSADEFARAMSKINEAVADHWPCMPLSAFAYGCCPCTLGLSFYCATGQVEEAESRALMQIRRVNEQENFKSRGVEFRLVRVWYKRKSYVEITVADGSEARPIDSHTTQLSAADASSGSIQKAPETQTMSERLV